MSDIAAEVGIKAPSIYKHFKGKDDIFESILKVADEKFNAEIIPFEPGELDTDKEAVIAKIRLRIFDYFYEDEFMTMVRNMLSMEMYKNPELMKIYMYEYIEKPLQSNFELFTRYLDFDDKEDTDALALAFYAPIYLALKICNSYPEKLEETRNNLEKIFNLFKCILDLNLSKMLGGKE